MSDAAITFDNLTLGYNSHPAVHHLSGTVTRGALTAVVGANGSGKSTLMKGIAGILKPMAGAVQVNNKARMAYLPQGTELDRSFPARVIDLVSMGLWPRRGLLGRYSRSDWQKVEAAIAAVGLVGFEARSLDTLSGGQLQRALFARVVLQDAELILLDEPFNAVDQRTIADLLALMQHWHREHRTVLVVVHDHDLVRQHLPEALLLARRPIAWGQSAVVLNSENLAKARHFDEAWDENAPWCAPGEHAHDHVHDAPHAHVHHDHGHHEHGHHDLHKGAA
ncbi:zinc ABC transporter ATP-binding protein AztA [Tianweitania sediminis]|jgi:zinc/manganese transport system ATP-binding protein|uniref:Metal ABC transporter ATP-binding protein n=1 Tax=Tianweitania sediminis TaxID=1502156 RepID=A0A8J7R047_9HYPH|nr:zinc ABC transporter ATP-binding protein AztA [Tianweitania sediminis]MBP0437575.1 metal ABC transporter ATP-binding protein [Tianweitania sediminis]HEV7418071.1 zinc ABC transporter ATP-binding protein AztA [Tianweitania sediminis]